jgi:hypothetical protein
VGDAGPGGRFFATIYLNTRGKQYLDPIEQVPGTVSYLDKNPFHYDLSTFDWVCEGTSLTAEYLATGTAPKPEDACLHKDRVA